MRGTLRVHRRRTWPTVKEVNVFDFSTRLFKALGDEESLRVGFGKDYLSRTPVFEGNVTDFSHRWLGFNLLRKFPGLKTGIDTRKTAMETFVECESRCSETNARLSKQRLGQTPSLAHVFHVAKEKIRAVLGEVPSFQKLDFRFGPGAAFECRRQTSAYNKMKAPLQMTFQMRPLLHEFRKEFPAWLGEAESFSLVHGSELTFVPKSAKTDRPICIEPLLNGLCQKGIGSYLKRRLQFAGVDLRDQRINQRLAGLALERDLATVDLKSASDLISFNLVFELLPIEWVELLDAVRSHRYFHDGVWREFHKFSSMGNAFTFELETLIFWAICHGVGSALGVQLKGVDYVPPKKEILGIRKPPKPLELAPDVNFSVYGDDIILPCKAVELLYEALQEAGFQVNHDKSFSGEHPFRESCGSDYYLGCDITPFKIQTRIRTVVDVNWLANSLRRWMTENARFLACHEALTELYWWVRNHIPKRDQLLGPPGYGDGSLQVDWDEARPSICRPSGRFHGFEGWLFYSYVEVAKLVPLDEWPIWYALYYAGMPDVTASKGYSTRGSVIRKVKRILCHDWQSNGPVL